MLRAADFERHKVRYPAAIIDEKIKELGFGDELGRSGYNGGTRSESARESFRAGKSKREA
jgi:hypothetical protein